MVGSRAMWPGLVLGLVLVGGYTRATTADAPVLLAAPPMMSEACERAKATYLAMREDLNFCTGHDECVEIVPETCIGPYYVNIATGDRGLRGIEQEVLERCQVPAVQCPRAGRGAPRCVRGRCRYVRRWNETAAGAYNFYRRLVPEFDRPYVVLTNRPARGWMPGEILVKNEAAGVLTLRVDMGGCGGEFEVGHDVYPDTGHVRRDRAGRVETIRVVLPADGEFGAWIDAGDPNCTQATVTAHFERQDGAPVRSRYHGVRYVMYGPE